MATGINSSLASGLCQRLLSPLPKTGPPVTPQQGEELCPQRDVWEGTFRAESLGAGTVSWSVPCTWLWAAEDSSLLGSQGKTLWVIQTFHAQRRASQNNQAPLR